MAHKDRRPAPLSAVRRLPVAVIEEATRLREAGDWRGALLAAGITTDLDLDALLSAYGAAATQRVADDLAALAPDLLRQYLAPYRAWSTFGGPAILRHEQFARNGMVATAALPDGPLIAVVGRFPGGRRSAHLLITQAARVPRYWRTMPVWTWRADAVDERQTAYAHAQPYAREEAEALDKGVLGVGDVHPLVHDVVFPGQKWQPPHYMWNWDPVRVRCGANWHEVQIVDGRFVTHAHTEAQIERELTLSGLSGPIVRCAEVVQAWRSGDGRLPKVLRWHRQDFFDMAARGHADAVHSALDAGFDPVAANGDGSNLLHLLPWIGLDLLPRLLSAGLSVNYPDKQGRTPLHWAYASDDPEVIQALLDAGADRTARDIRGRTPRSCAPQLSSLARQLAIQPERPRSLLGRLLGRGAS